jgi:hypothetical protein
MPRIKPPSPPVIDGTPAKHSGTGNHPVTRVVIHSAVMPCEPGRAHQLGQMNSAGSGGGSWHYATDPAETFQCSFDSYVCWHAPPNSNSIGIEMADMPGPAPSDELRPTGARLLTAKAVAAWKSGRRSWRWAKKDQRAMLRRTAKLTAHLCLAYDLPLRFRGPRALRNGKRGITTHANVSAAWGESTHWDPGWWPRAWFMVLVRRHAKRLQARG